MLTQRKYTSSLAPVGPSSPSDFARVMVQMDHGCGHTPLFALAARTQVTPKTCSAVRQGLPHTSSPDSSRLDSSNQDGPTSPSQARRGREGGRDRRRTQRTRPARPSPPRRPTTRNQRPHADRPPEEKHPSPKTPQFQQRERRPPCNNRRERNARQSDPFRLGETFGRLPSATRKNTANAPDTVSPPRGLAT